MAYIWITPKTNWKASNYFTYTDYNRIRNNLLYISDKINKMFPEKAKTLKLGNPKTGYNDNYYASEFNNFEKALKTFAEITGNDFDTKSGQYLPNGQFINYKDLNRIESAILKWNDFAPPLESATVSPTEIKFSSIGDTQQLTLDVEPYGAEYTVTWTSSNTKIATVDENGLVTAVANGEFTINIVVKGKNKNGGVKTIKLKVNGVLAQGSCFFFNNQKYYYDFMVVGKEKNKANDAQSSICDVYLLPRYRTTALVGKWGTRSSFAATWHDPYADYRQTVYDFMKDNFSKKLQSSLRYYYCSDELATLNREYDVGGINTRYRTSRPHTYNWQPKAGYNSKVFLPSPAFYGLSSPRYASPQDNYAYKFYYTDPITNKAVENPPFTQAQIDGEPLIEGEDKGQLVQMRILTSQPEPIASDNSYSVASVLNGSFLNMKLDSIIPLRPVFAMFPTTMVYPKPNSEGVYIIDWNKGQDSIHVGKLPLGTLIRDDSGI